MKKLIVLLLCLFSVQLFAQISGKSKAGRLFTKKIIPQNKVITEPRITILSPEIGQGSFSTSDQKIIIHGKIEDDYGIESTTINSDYLSLLKSGEFYYELILNKGINNVSIEVINIEGKKTQKSFPINFQQSVLPKPQIVLLEPILNSKKEYISQTEIIKIRGKVNNLDSGSEFKINNSLVSISQSGEFSYPIRLQNENNIFSLIATNSQKNITELTFSVIKSAPESIPVITILEPRLPLSNELNHSETIITIRGKVDDKYDIRNIEVNNKRAALLGKNEFFANVNLNDGINNIVVSAVNVKGKTAEKFFKIITPVDDQGPEIAILEPAVSRGLKIVRKKDVLNVRGKVSDRSGVLNVSVNNREVSLLPNNEFNSQLYLGIGETG